MPRLVDFSLSDCFEGNGSFVSMEEQIILLELDGFQSTKNKLESFPIRLRNSFFLLVLSGEVNINVDYLSHTLKRNMVIQLTAENIIENIVYSSDIKGYIMLFSQELKSEIMAKTTGIRLPGSGQLKRNHPIHELTEEECQIILGHILLIRKYIIEKTHIYRSPIIRNEIMNLHFELDNSRWKKYGHVEENNKLSRNEILREQFRELLLQKCKEHHDVHYYASELFVTPDYLSRVIREYDGQSAMKWIINAVLTEAKIQLRLPEKSINQIAQELHFPDQSTFGKFFKRYMSISPAEYRKKLLFV